jgi:hypothetical protein
VQWDAVRVGLWNEHEWAAVPKNSEDGDDGPAGLGKVRYGGKVYEGIPAGAWRVFEKVWNSKHQTCSMGDLAGVDRNDHAEDAYVYDVNNFKNDQRIVRKFFEEHGIPWRLAQSGGDVTIKGIAG